MRPLRYKNLAFIIESDSEILTLARTAHRISSPTNAVILNDSIETQSIVGPDRL